MNLALEVYLRFEDKKQVTASHTTNISREGVFIKMDPPRPLGTKVRIKVEVDDSLEAFDLEGVVVRTVPDGDREAGDSEVSGVGVFFTATSEGWSQFCEKLK